MAKAHGNSVYDSYLKGERPVNSSTLSGIELKQLFTADDVSHMMELAGEYPFTRGIHPDMYRNRYWTRRQQSGFGGPRESNERFKFLLESGQTGINFDCDVPTKLGLDPDHVLAEDDIGLCGTSVATLEDMEQLFDGIPLDKVSTTLIIQPPYSAVLLAMYLLVARKRGIPEDTLVGTVMNDAVAQLVGLNYQASEDFFPFSSAVRIGFDVMEYCTRNMPKWNILNINAYNMRETGYISAVQEVAFSISAACDYIKGLLDRGLSIDDFARRIAFFCASDIDFLEEVAKFRAMRRMWAKLLRESFGAQDPRSCWFRAAVQTSALPLTQQQPLNNIVGATIQTLAAVLGGAQSIHTTSYDEAYALPTEESHKLAVRTQQVIAYETNVVKTVDPLGGSFAVEWLTDKIEEQANALMRVIEEEGGFFRCYEKGWVDQQVEQARAEHAKRLEDGQTLSVGVNIACDEDDLTEINIFRHASDMQHKRIHYIKEYKKNRDHARVRDSLDYLCQQAKKDVKQDLFQPILHAVDARATLGEICDTLRSAENLDLSRWQRRAQGGSNG